LTVLRNDSPKILWLLGRPPSGAASKMKSARQPNRAEFHTPE
jgi:hypothetical protein